MARLLPRFCVGKKMIGWVLLVALCVATGCALNIQLAPRVAAFEETVLSGEGDDKVLMIDIQGTISDRQKKSPLGSTVELGLVERTREMLERAEKDPSIKALWLRINSPGGTVTSSDMIYHDLKIFKEKRKIKIYVSFMDLAASGGYYIAMAGDTIFAHPTSLTGSIGVIAMKPNLQGLMGKVGVDMEVVKSGEKKDFLSPFRPLTEVERNMFQATIDEYHLRFVQIITENRPGLDLAAVKGLADGRVFTAQQALKSRLIDRIGYLEDALALIKKELNVSKVKVVTYHRPGEYKTNLYSSTNLPPIMQWINLDLDSLLPATGPQFLYLWSP
jgi:protease-4